MEGGVKIGDAGYCWKLFFAEADDFQCGEVVPVGVSISTALSDVLCGLDWDCDTYSGARSSRSSRWCSVSLFISTDSL